MKILLNYADGKFINSQLLNSQSGLAAGFNVVYQMGRGDIDPQFHAQHKEILDQKRGVGYWLWKAHFITRLLSGMGENDILFYADSGSYFIRRMEPVFAAVSADPKGVVAFRLAGGHVEKAYTKRDLFLHMGMNEPQYRDTPQRMASFMCFRGTAAAREIAAEYLNLCSTPHLITDTPNVDGWIEDGFVDHRHDQSVWSLLTKRHEITTLADPTQWGVHHKENSEEQQFLVHTRDPR